PQEPAEEPQEPEADEPEEPVVDEELPEDPVYIGMIMTDEAIYLAAMNEFIWAFEDLTEFLYFLLTELEYVETDDEFVEWIEAFYIIMDAVGESAEDMTATALLAPPEFVESHIQIAAAVSLVYDSMHALDEALAAAILGDYDALLVGLEGFAINLAAAEMLWEQAVGVSAFDPALIGTWGWEYDAGWTYTFFPDGTGTRGTAAAFETFEWETRDIELWIDLGPATPQGHVRFEHWAYVIVDGVLIIESLQAENMIFAYILQ
ncbi:MAG: hypothetical protein FWB75_09070, partial [Oscillospiraceae bacterium]|nr:hypothetical protein [Oscillospiraceae bacterium]